MKEANIKNNWGGDTECVAPLLAVCHAWGPEFTNSGCISLWTCEQAKPQRIVHFSGSILQYINYMSTEQSEMSRVPHFSLALPQIYLN